MSGSQIAVAEGAATASGKSTRRTTTRKPSRNGASGHRGSGDDDDPYPQGEPLLRKGAVAALLGQYIRTVDRLVEAGEMQLIYIGPQSPRIPKSSYDAFVARAVRKAAKARAA